MSKQKASKVVALAPVSAAPPAGLLPWEDKAAFLAVRREFLDAYAPNGPVETSLIDRMVWIEWRRARLRGAEAALHVAHAFDRAGDDQAKRKTLARAGVTDWKVRDEISIGDILRDTDASDAESLIEIQEGMRQTERALERLISGDGYAAALGEMDKTLAEWWQESLEETRDDGSRTYSESAEALQRFLETDALPWRRRWLAANEARPAIRAQAIAESLDPGRVNQIWAMEGQLDRQFEKALTMLLRLQEMRLDVEGRLPVQSEPEASPGTKGTMRAVSAA